LINNAGANWGAPLEEFPDAGWDKVMALNVKSIFYMTRYCLPLLEQSVKKNNTPARVINIGSIDGTVTDVIYR
jgi:NAD(P)-dependent dehydrogenase (short-subunit alcohol dehydrogenase family)